MLADGNMSAGCTSSIKPSSGRVFASTIYLGWCHAEELVNTVVDVLVIHALVFFLVFYVEGLPSLEFCEMTPSVRMRVGLPSQGGLIPA